MAEDNENIRLFLRVEFSRGMRGAILPYNSKYIGLDDEIKGLLRSS
jgi:hypothetical protein